jgi:hypothetical protein
LRVVRDEGEPLGLRSIELHKAGPTGGYFTEEFASTSKVSILNAGKGEYEALILDLLGID